MIEWLIDAGVITECHCLQFPELPLKGNIEEGKYKLYYPDTGLLVSALDEEAQEYLRVNKNLGVYKGAFYEIFLPKLLLNRGLDYSTTKKKNLHWRKISLYEPRMILFRLMLNLIVISQSPCLH